MARQATSGQPRNVTEIGGSYDINEDDDYVALSALWGGGTVVLPGPNSSHPAPNNGDQYTVADPQNILTTSGHSVTLNGGGYKFLSAGALVTQATLTLLLTSTNAALVSCCIKFTFDAASQIWIVEF